MSETAGIKQVASRLLGMEEEPSTIERMAALRLMEAVVGYCRHYCGFDFGHIGRGGEHPEFGALVETILLAKDTSPDGSVNALDILMFGDGEAVAVAEPRMCSNGYAGWAIERHGGDALAALRGPEGETLASYYGFLALVDTIVGKDVRLFGFEGATTPQDVKSDICDLAMRLLVENLVGCADTYERSDENGNGGR